VTACQGSPACRYVVSDPPAHLGTLLHKLQSSITTYEKEQSSLLTGDIIIARTNDLEAASPSSPGHPDSACHAAKTGLIAARESALFAGRKSVSLRNTHSVNRMNSRLSLGPETCTTLIQTPVTSTISSIEPTSNTSLTLKTILTLTTTSLLP
jgi:hypothetical protein